MLFSQFYAIFRALSAMRTVAVFMADSIGTDIDNFNRDFTTIYLVTVQSDKI